MEKEIGKKIADSVTPVAGPHISMSAKELGKEKLKKFIEEETRTVRGVFQCFETPGARVKIIVKKYPGIPIFEKEMDDGREYEVPLYVARHLNGIDVTAKAIDGKLNTCSYAVHGFKWDPGAPAPASRDGDGGIPVPLVGINKRVRRYGFQSMEFGAVA
jgi:hypothetical protein